MSIVSRVQINSRSRQSLADAVSLGLRSAVSSIGGDGRRVHVEEIHCEPAEPGDYRVSMWLAVESAEQQRP